MQSLIFNNQSSEVVQATKMLEKIPNCNTYLLMSHEGDVLVVKITKKKKINK